VGPGWGRPVRWSVGRSPTAGPVDRRPHDRSSPLSPTADDVAALPGDTALRNAAAERARAAGLPSPDVEEWRYSRIDELDLDRYAPVLAAPDGAASAASAPTAGDPEDEWAAVVTVVDGWVASIDVRDPAVTVTTDGAGAGSVLGDAPDALVDWAIALAPAAVTVSVDRGVTVAAPVLVRTIATVARGLSAPRLAVSVGEDAELTVVEQQSATVDDALVLPVVELDVATRGRLAHTAIQRLPVGMWQIGSVTARVGQESRLVSAHAALGGEYARLRTDCRLEGRGASGDLLAAYFGEGDQTLDFRTFQDHVAPDTHSDLLFKGAVGGRSRSIYTGLITVRPTARGTNAYQTNRNLKLSDEAWAESVPNLEIQNNDVRCSHASTVGPIDVDQRFYLESRGVPPQVAERLVVSGFFAEVLARFPAPAPVLAEVADAIADRLDRQVGAGVAS